MNGRKVSRLAATIAAGTMLAPLAAHAGGGAGTTFLGADFSYNGFLRVDTAFSTDDRVQQANQFGDLANGIPIRRTPGNPVTGYTTVLQPTDSIIGPAGTIPLSGIGVLPPTRGVSQQVGVNDTFTRYVPLKNQLLNYHLLRFEATPTLSWGNISLITRIRAVYDAEGLGYQEFDYRNYQDINGGITGGETRQFHSTPDHLGYQVQTNHHPILFEQSGRNYQVDLPAFFLQYNSGPATLRVGNQSVAWGQLLFFRLFDTANGLDLRRHLILNKATEEYADVRESAPGLRFTYQLSDQITLDSFAQQFIPSVLPNVNTPYNIVPSQFTIHDYYSQNGYNKDINYGFRVRGEFGGFSLQAMATHRYNPLGAIRWTQSGVNKPLPNSNILGAAFNQYCNVLNGAAPLSPAGCGPELAKTPFEVAPAGVFTAEEWFNYAGYIKLDGLGGLNAAVNDFPAAQQLLAQPIGRNPDAAANELSAFFSAGEGLRGHIERQYFAENVFGLGGSYVVDAAPGSILDQLIINLEGTYTPKRVFTAVTLGKDFDKEDEIQLGLSTEKYQRFSSSFPATYLVAQYLWQKNSDLAGLLLKGYGSQNYSRNGIQLDAHVPTSANPKIVPGVAPGANYLVLAAVQPFPNYIYELSFASLLDIQGGLLLQPGFTWKPRGNITVNLNYNLVLDNIYGNNPNKNLIHLLSQTNEATVRLGYQF